MKDLNDIWLRACSLFIPYVTHCMQHEDEGYQQVVSSSGGNAGMAAACAAKALGLKATIVIPESTPGLMIPKLQKQKADVIVSRAIYVLYLSE